MSGSKNTKTIPTIENTLNNKERFDVEFLDEAKEFLRGLSREERIEMVSNIDAAKKVVDSGLFKKVNKFIWEFRAKHNGKQFRILSFWDKTRKSMVMATHGFIKKTQKVPPQEIKHAEQIMKKYYANKNN